jgi:mannose-6-phosphate isomerase-like protein (cupin superfamily)
MVRHPKPDDIHWSASQPPGFIIPEALYTREEAKARLRMGDQAWADFRRKGAKAVRFGRRDYVLGAWIIEAMTKIAKEVNAAATLIPKPTVVPAAGNPPKIIEEFVGRVNSGTTAVSIARMKSPSGWSEPGQTPEFDEYTVVLQGKLHVRLQDKELDVEAGQAIIVEAGEWVQYSTPSPEGAEYFAVCIPAFSPDAVHRE